MVRLYQLIEKMRAREWSSAALAVDEAHRVRQRAEQGRRADDTAARNGLAAGSWVEAYATVAGHHAAEVQRRALDSLHVLRTKEVVVARAIHRASMTEVRQLETILASALEAETELEERAIQTASDDRYLSRREWMRKRTLRQQA
jgi:hypothetical protein